MKSIHPNIPVIVEINNRIVRIITEKYTEEVICYAGQAINEYSDESGESTILSLSLQPIKEQISYSPPVGQFSQTCFIPLNKLRTHLYKIC